MKTIEYSPTGQAFADALAEEASRDFLEHASAEYIAVSTDNFITTTRVHVLRGLISHEEVEFVFQGEVIRLDSDGRVKNWPRGFCDYTEHWLYELLRGRVKAPG